MANKNNKLFEIKKPFLMMVEGKDDAAMLYRLCEHMGISSEQFQIFEYGGKEKFPNALRFISNLEEFEIVNKLAVFRDADENSESAFQSIEHHLKACELILNDAIPAGQGIVAHSENDQESMSIGVFITPNCADVGALESLLLGSLTDDMRAELDRFISNSETCLSSEKTHSKFKKSDKSKTYAYSALFENANFRDTFSKQLWDYEHPVFDALKSFLTEFEDQSDPE